MESRYSGTTEGSLVIQNISQSGNITIDNSAFLDIYNDEIYITKLPAIVYTSIMMILGLPGNIIVFYIYFFKWRRSTSRMFILFLAALDTMNCSTTLPMEIYIMRNSLKLDQPVLCKLSRYSTYVMNCASALILVGIAADRFKRICRPYQRSFSENQSKYISIAAILFSMATTWPALIFYGTRKVNLGNVTGSACLLENKFDKSPYPIVYFGYMVSSTMLTFAILIILYYFVGLQIYKHRRFKLKNCTHVQKIVDEKSLTMKSEKSNGEKLKSSNTDDKSNGEKPKAPSIGIQINGEDHNDKEKELNGGDEQNIVIVVKEETVKGVDADDDEDKLKPYQLGLPPPCQDVGTSCGLLDVPYQDDDKNGSDVSSRNISFATKETAEHSINDLNVEEKPKPKKTSPQRKYQNSIKKKRKKRRVRYLLVRGASTLNASGRAKCVDCLTVRIGRSTLMLFLITIVFVISFLPFYTLVIVRQSNPSFVSRMSKSGLAAYHVFLRSYLLSSAVNPFVYSFCNVQFREYCKDTFSRIFLRRQQSYMNHKGFVRRFR